MIRVLKNEKGVALPAVMMVMLVVMLLSAGLVSLVTAQTKEQIYYEEEVEALHSAEAGANTFLWSMNKEGIDLLEADTGTVYEYPVGNPTHAYQLTGLVDGGYIRTVNLIGWSLDTPDIKRTITVTYQKRAFHQYVYFSDNDPENIWWMTGENCYGPYHTNTNLSIDGDPVFWGKVTYVLGITLAPNKTNNPKYYQDKQQIASIDMPQSNTTLMNYGKSSDGYYYEGRTQIMLNSDGTVTIRNHNEKQDIIQNHIPLPRNGVIYVNGTTEEGKFNKKAGNVFISGTLKGRLTVASSNNIYVTAFDPTIEGWNNVNKSEHKTMGITYANTKINMSTSGTTLNLTATDNNGNALSSSEGDMLGLIATQNVEVLTYGWFDLPGQDSSGSNNMQIYGAIMAIKGSFLNSIRSDKATYYYPSAKKNLIVRGSIIQKTRGIVGQNGGFIKDYAHDPRMMYEGPPYFLDPANTGWEMVGWEEK